METVAETISTFAVDEDLVAAFADGLKNSTSQVTSWSTPVNWGKKVESNQMDDWMSKAFTSGGPGNVSTVFKETWKENFTNGMPEINQGNVVCIVTCTYNKDEHSLECKLTYHSYVPAGGLTGQAQAYYN